MENRLTSNDICFYFARMIDVSKRHRHEMDLEAERSRAKDVHTDRINRTKIKGLEEQVAFE